jgi:hypothetical protein
MPGLFRDKKNLIFLFIDVFYGVVFIDSSNFLGGYFLYNVLLWIM